MSFGPDEDLRFAEDHIANLRNALDNIHAAMSYPFVWSADTHDAVAAILGAEGYTWPDDDPFDPAGDPPTHADLAPWRPAGGYCRLSCHHLKYDPDTDGCGCPCHEEE